MHQATNSPIVRYASRKGTPFLVGGGYGVAPLWFLATHLPRKGILFVGGRTAADILGLIRHVQRTVKERFGVELETEVKLTGQF